MPFPSSQFFDATLSMDTYSYSTKYSEHRIDGPVKIPNQKITLPRVSLPLNHLVLLNLTS